MTCNIYLLILCVITFNYHLMRSIYQKTIQFGCVFLSVICTFSLWFDRLLLSESVCWYW